jgi:hypothetical protein
METRVVAVTAQHFTVNRKPRRRAQLGLALEGKAPRATPVPSTKQRETEIQRDILRLLKQHPSVAFAHRINTRVLDVPDEKSPTGTRPMRMAPKGHPDLCGMLKDGRALYVEVKAANGTLTEEQAAFLSLVNRYGGIGIVASSVDMVLRYLPLPRHATRATG